MTKVNSGRYPDRNMDFNFLSSELRNTYATARSFSPYKNRDSELLQRNTYATTPTNAHLFAHQFGMVFD